MSVIISLLLDTLDFTRWTLLHWILVAAASLFFLSSRWKKSSLPEKEYPNVKAAEITPTVKTVEITPAVKMVDIASTDGKSRRRRQRKSEKKEENGCCGGKQDEGCCSTDAPSKDSSCCKSTPESTEPKPQTQISEKTEDGNMEGEELKKSKLKILYATQTRTSRSLALRLKELVESSVPLIETVEVINIAEYENEDLQTETNPVVFMLSTYSEGTPTEDASWFYTWLEDTRYDHRVDKTCLRKLRYAVFGLGDSVYEEHYCTVAKRVDKWISEMGGRRMCPLDFGDKSDDTEFQFMRWTKLLLSRLNGVAEHLSVAGVDDDEEYGNNLEYTTTDDEQEDEEEAGSGGELMDLEDMGKMASKIKTARQQRDDEESAVISVRGGARRGIGNTDDEKRPEKMLKEMVTPMLRKSLEKQGYKIVGTHSGVKICRWTKAMLRGNGGCYKWTLYGIESHRCMETTPSLACANKCVFCWRQHTNPVGTEWRWKMDDALDIVDGAMANHYKMIKQLKGVPGVKPDRFEEAFTIRHCALSLVGEPIMYPQINEFVEILHSRNISSFLVTNAQFPEAIENLTPVTQLYVSIDAGTKEDLKKIDRPLFRDFWERFLACLDNIGKKGQRTVYRLTLVKDKNDDTLDSYATLIARGNPDFIEVKGVTYCGFSGASNLTMKNVPYHYEVLQFCRDLCTRLGGKYEVACVHEHTCCVLIADKARYFRNNEWWTWIDYHKFFALVKEGKPFTSIDYMAKTPSWAVVGDQHAGFDPEQLRVYRKSKNPRKTEPTSTELPTSETVTISNQDEVVER